MKYILGLDVSTSCTGWCVLRLDDDTSIHLEEIGYIPLQKCKSLSDKAIAVRDAFNEICKSYHIHYTFIEENLQVFRPGFSSAKTLLTLARFNGVASFLSWEAFKIDPQFFKCQCSKKISGPKDH